MRYGVYADPEVAPIFAEAGFEFMELSVQAQLKPEEDEAAFLTELTKIEAAPIPCPVANRFVPGHLKITGPDVDLDALTEYVLVAFERAQRAGLDTIVFGSGGARRVPEGFSRTKAEQQLVAFGKIIAPLAQHYNITVVVEPLNQKECNILTGLRESADYVRAVEHPHLQLLVDAYHWYLEEENAEDIIACAPLLRHVHIATYDARLAPGLEPCDFSEFFRGLREGNYNGRVSIEGRWSDMPNEAAGALAELKRFAE